MRLAPDITEEWLKENDPEYGTGKYYLNNRRFRRILEEWEYPTNQIDKTKRGACV